jgi:hypothetical protein
MRGPGRERLRFYHQELTDPDAHTLENIPDQGRDQRIPGRCVVLIDAWLGHIIPVMGMTLLGDKRGHPRHLTTHPPHRGDQLGHCVLGRDPMRITGATSPLRSKAIRGTVAMLVDGTVLRVIK